MLDEELISKYCDAVLKELNKYRDTYNKRHVCYGTGKYRNNVDDDVFVTLDIPEKYVVPVVNILVDQELATKLYYRFEPSIDDATLSECRWIGITDNGRHFIQTQSFHNNFLKRKFQEQKEGIEFDKNKQDLQIGKWLLKTKWWPFAISASTGLWTIYDFINDRADKTSQIQRIEALERKLQETKSETYIPSDSLYQIKHSKDTSKKN